MRTRHTNFGGQRTFETLEQRALLAAIVVNSLADNATPGDGKVTLREAILAANNDTTTDTGQTGSGADTITFKLKKGAHTINLTGALPHLASDLEIKGPGADLLTIRRDTGGEYRIFTVDFYTVSLTGMTITNGLSSGDWPYGGGGGIYNDHGLLTLTDCVVSGNHAKLASGGGIFNDASYSFGGGGVILVNSIVCNNTADYSGGGIFNDAEAGLGGWIEVDNSTIRDNYCAYSGGAIYNDGEQYGNAYVSINNSTLSGNRADFAGGAIFNDGNVSSGGQVVITWVNNSTISGNSAGFCGGIDNEGFSGFGALAVLRIINSTFSANKDDGSFCGDIFNGGYGNCAFLNIGSTILNGAAGTPTILNSDVVNDLGYNLASDDTGGALTAATDLLNTDPKLGPLQDNGGPTFTHALLPGSPAIDAGLNIDTVLTDQRLTYFDRTFDDPAVPNATAGDGTDIGATEVQEKPSGQIADLIALLNGWSDVPSGIKSALVAKLRTAAKALGRHGNRAALEELNAFIQQAKAQSGKKLTVDEANQLIAQATRIRFFLSLDASDRECGEKKELVENILS